jgi:microcin C transport system substrate-binding protein
MKFLAAAILLAIAAIAGAAQAAPRHGLSAFGDLKYPPDFAHFDYVDPNAPKGGRMALIGPVPRDTFDSFNGYIMRGDPVQGYDLMFDSLMARAEDEPDAVYGLVAATADLADDRQGVTFALRPEARFADGSALTAADVCESYRLLSSHGDERIRITIRDVTSCEELGPHAVRYRFQGTRTRDLPLTVASLPIFSKAYYQKVDFTRSTLEPPLGSGPYAVKAFKAGEFVAYGRRADWWAKDLPVNRGRYNFDEIRFEYFRDRTAGLEALSSGVLDLREEYTSRDWATAYEFPAVKEGLVVRLDLPDETPSGAQGYFFNLRRDKFKDIKVRQALSLAFDFEWTNANLFFGLYKRTASFFEVSKLKAEGYPSPEELALLEPLRANLGPEVFAPPALPPVSDGSGQDRKLLRAAGALLDEAGWKLDGTIRRNARGEALAIEFLIDAPVFERILTPYVKNLRLLGVDATIRTVDEVQYQLRQETYDFDVISSRFSAGVTPGDGLRVFFGSASANAPGTYNLSGIATPEIDALIDRVVGARSRAELEIAGRALDRVLRAEHFWVPNWHKASHWIAHWDRFGRPAVKPKYDRGIIDTWWYDEAKAQRIAKGN